MGALPKAPVREVVEDIAYEADNGLFSMRHKRTRRPQHQRFVFNDGQKLMTDYSGHLILRSSVNHNRGVHWTNVAGNRVAYVRIP